MTVFNLFNIGSALFNTMTLCQLIKAIDDFNGKFGIGGVGDVFLLYGGVNQYGRLLGLFTMQGDTHFKRDLCINRDD